MKDHILQKQAIRHSRMLCDSFKRLMGKSLIDGDFASDEELARALYRAPFALLSHDTQEDPVFNYANETAQILWEMTWEEFVGLPSRFSVEPVKTEERKAMLEEARKKGCISNYQGVRISRSGRRFMIKDATLWNVEDPFGLYHGQAAVFLTWEYLGKYAKHQHHH